MNINPAAITTVSRPRLSQQNLKQAEKQVKKIQRKIAEAYLSGDKARVASLQKILVNSYAARIVATNRVISNRGGKTPGIDGFVVTTVTELDSLIAKLAEVTADPAAYKASPVRQVLIPKANSTEKRPLGIPTVFDRCVQALYALALVPIAEATADRNSFGFRAQRGTHDAVFTAKNELLKLPQPHLILDADIAKFFDTVSHDWLLQNIPMDSRILNSILTAGKIVDGDFMATTQGFPQGSVISPILANMTLDGLEGTIIGSLSKYPVLAEMIRVVRYADDFVALGPNKRWAYDDYIVPAIKAFLSERGLALSEKKTSLVTREDGFDFLGFNLQWVKSPAGKFWLRITPSDKAVRKFKQSVTETFDSNKSLGSRPAVIDRLNSFLSGWGNYYRYGHSSIAQSTLDKFVWDSYRAWMKGFFPATVVNDTEFRKRAFVKVGNVTSVPFYRSNDGKIVSLRRLSAIKSQMNYQPRTPTVDNIFGSFVADDND